MSIDVLNWLALPDSVGVERDRILRNGLNVGSDGGYDFRTLFYDAFFVPRSRSICLVCPKLLNLSAVVEEGLFTSAEESLKPRIARRHPRFDEVWLRCSGVPERLRFRFRSLDREVPVSLQDDRTFEGLGCAILRSKDNELAWIRDWAEYHVKIHGLQGVVFFDNGSETYSVEEIRETLLGVSGLEAVRVLSAPFPYAPPKTSNFKRAAHFLSAALLNVARLRYLQPAAAVLVTDVDELVPPCPGGGIFALTERSPLGYVLFPGRWRYPDPTEAGLVRHADHVYRSKDGFCSATKYCICPRGPLRSLRWGAHIVGSGSWVKEAIRRSTLGRFEYWHCRKISTGWKYPRVAPPPDQLTLDPEAKRALDRAFGSDL